MSNDGLLLEDLDNKFDAVIEMVVQMRDDMDTKLATKEDLAAVETKLTSTIQAAVLGVTLTVDDHETRMIKLETV